MSIISSIVAMAKNILKDLYLTVNAKISMWFILCTCENS